MKLFSRRHKLLLLAWTIGLAAILAGHFYYIRPLQRRADELAGRIDTHSRDILASGWPASRRQLTDMLSQREERVADLDRRMQQVWRRIERTFEGELERFGGDLDLFADQVTRLDFAEAYTRILYGLEASGKWGFAPEILGLSEHTASKTVYEMMFQLWVLEKVVRLFDRHGLVAVQEPLADFQLPAGGDSPGAGESAADRGVSGNASRLTCLPVRSYTRPGIEQKPFLLEIPIRFDIVGTPVQFQRFMADLTDPDSENFLAMDRLEIRSLPPTAEDASPRLRVAGRIAAFARLPGEPRTEGGNRQPGAPMEGETMR